MTTRNRRIAGVALSVFSSGAVFVACLGLYGLVAQSVCQRRREIGVRVVVGAAPSMVLKLFLQEGALLIAAGLGVGIAIAIPATRLMRNIVFDVSTTDPWTYAGVAELLFGVGVVTSGLDPVAALRS